MRRLLPVLLLAGLLITPAATAYAQSSPAEISFWESVRDSDVPDEIEAYLTAYPKGTFSNLAKIRIKVLKGNAADKTTSLPPNLDNLARGQKQVTTVKIGEQKNSKRGLLGVRIATVTAEWATVVGLKKARGAFVVSVTPKGPADIAGIKFGDVIIQVEGQDIGQKEEVAKIIGATPPGKEIEMVIWRAGRDSSKLLYNLRSRAEKGSASAAINLANRYMDGDGVPKDYVEALKWYRKAAEKGHARAMFNLGFLLETGRGVVRNEAEAVKWYRKAEAKGEDDATTRLKLLGAGQGSVRRGTTKSSGASALGDLKSLQDF